MYLKDKLRLCAVMTPYYMAPDAIDKSDRKLLGEAQETYCLIDEQPERDPSQMGPLCLLEGGHRKCCRQLQLQPNQAENCWA